MNTRLGIKNFRIFDENGVFFDISPITILTGTNSAGKSTMAKGCILLESFLNQINFEIEKCRLDFMTYPLNTLGRYDKAVHKGSQSQEISFSYSVFSDYFFDEVTVSMTFNRDEHDDLNNGILDRLLISSGNNVIYSWSRNGGYEENYCNYYLLKDKFSDFIRYEMELKKLAELNKQKEMDMMDGCEGEYYEEEEEISRFMSSCDKRLLVSVMMHMSNANRDNPYFGEVLNEGMIEKLRKENTLFHFSIYEKTADMDDDEIEEFLVKLAEKLECNKPVLVNAVRKLMNSYRMSKEESFVNYIASLEKSFLKSGNLKDYHLGFWPFKLTLNTCLENVMTPSKVYFSFFGPRNPKVLAHINDMEGAECNFIFAYELLSILDFACQTEPEDYYWEYTHDFDAVPVHKMYDVFKKYFKHFIYDCLNPGWNITYVGSTRVDVRKMYSLENKDSFTKLLVDYFDCIKAVRNKENVIYLGINEKKYVINSFTNKWLDKFGVCKELILKTDENGLGVQIYVRKNENDKPELLAYEGYGITQLVSLIMQIEVSILKAKSKYNRTTGLEYFNKFHYEEQTIIIEEPEIHLHPKYQSLLADMFYEAYKEYGINFIIETHSEYLIRKTQVLVSKMGFKDNEDFMENNPFQTIYISTDKLPYSLEYRRDGKFKNDFGPGFFDEAVNLMMEIF